MVVKISSGRVRVTIEQGGWRERGRQEYVKHAFCGAGAVQYLIHPSPRFF